MSSIQKAYQDRLETNAEQFEANHSEETAELENRAVSLEQEKSMQTTEQTNTPVSYYDRPHGMKDADTSRSFNNFSSNNRLNVEDIAIASAEVEMRDEIKIDNKLDLVGVEQDPSTEAMSTMSASTNQTMIT